MPTLRIPFPEQETPAIIELRGQKITVGRLPDNTVQLIDRTISAHHAELIEEGDHYRVRDIGATNGIQVDGQVVTDFHLREACKVTFGGVECEFSPDPADVALLDPSHKLVTHGEYEKVVAEAKALQAKATALEEEIARLKQSHTAGEGATVPQADFDKVVAEVAELKECLIERDREYSKLKADFAVLWRDRAVVKRALNEATKAAAAAAEKAAAEAAAPVPAAAPAAASVPAPASIPAANAPTAPSAPSAPAHKPVYSKPTARPAAPAAAPTGRPTPLSMPKAVPAANANGGLPKPPTPLPTPSPAAGAPVTAQARPGMPTARPMPMKKPPMPTSAIKPPTATARSGSTVSNGPQGTQKIST